MKIIKFITPILVALVAFMAFAVPLDVFAANGTLFMTPAEGRFTPGSTFSVEVRANTGNAARPVTRATIQYPNTILEAVDSNSFGSEFGNSSTSFNHSTGRVTYTAYDSTPPNGSNLFVYRVTFKVIGQGEAKVNFSSDVAVNGTLANGQAAQYQLYPARCPNGQTGTPPNCSVAPSVPQNPSPSPTTPNRPGTGTQPSKKPPASPSTSPPAAALPSIPLPPMPEPEEPVVSTEPVELPPETEEAFGIGNITTQSMYDTSTIRWQSNHPATSTLLYGTSADALDKRLEVTGNDSTEFSAVIPDLQPGEKYFYKISAQKTADTTKTDTHASSVTTKGYPVKVTAFYNSELLAGATLSLKNFSGTTTTDDEGAAALELKEGTYEVVIKQNEITIEKTIAVKSLDFPAGKVPDTQNFTLTAASSALAGSGGVVIVIALLVLLLTAGMVVVLIVRKKRASAQSASYHSVVIDDWTPPTQTTYVNPTTGAFTTPPPPSYPTAPPDANVPENEYFADLDKR